MPPGHPVPGAEPPDANPNEDPHQAQQGEIPKDGAMREPSLPVGSLVVALRDAFEAPLPDLNFELRIVHSTVASGESREAVKGVTDEEGAAMFNDLKVGSGHSYGVFVTYKDAQFFLKDIRLDDRTGAVAILHVYEPEKDFTQARVLGLTNVRIGHKDDMLVVTYQVMYENPGPFALVVNESLVLPPGNKALSTPDGAYPTVVATDTGVQLQGTLRPGRHFIPFSFQVPVESDGDQTLQLPFFPNMVESSVRVTASKKMAMEVPGYSAAKRDYDGEASWLQSERRLTDLKSGFIQNAEVKLTGLPTRPWGAYAAAVLGALAIIVGGVYIGSRRGRGESKESIDDLVEARAALLEEFVALEKAKARGDIGPKSYARIRQAMLESLARIMDRLNNAASNHDKTLRPYPEGRERLGVR